MRTMSSATPLRDPRDRSVRLAASVAHEVRNVLASILYSADFLDVEGGAASPQVWRETLGEIGEATRRLQLMSGSLLELAGLGPAIAVPVSLRSVLARAQALLLAFFREHAHALRVEFAAGDVWVRGNPLLIEQVLLHAVMGAVTSSPERAIVFVRSAAGADGGSVGFWIGSEGFCRPQQAPLWPCAATFAETVSMMASQGGQLRIAAGPDAPSDALFWLELPRSEGPR